MRKERNKPTIGAIRHHYSVGSAVEAMAALSKVLAMFRNRVLETDDEEEDASSTALEDVELPE